MLTGEEPEREGPMENDGRTGNDVPRFDPITGEPLNEQQMRFDPQTGRPINAAGAGTPSPQMRFDPQTGRQARKENGLFRSALLRQLFWSL